MSKVCDYCTPNMGIITCENCKVYKQQRMHLNIFDPMRGELPQSCMDKIENAEKKIKGDQDHE